MRKIETLVTVLTFIAAVTITLTALLAIILWREAVRRVQSARIVHVARTKSATLRLLSFTSEQQAACPALPPVAHADQQIRSQPLPLAH